MSPGAIVWLSHVLLCALSRRCRFDRGPGRGPGRQGFLDLSRSRFPFKTFHVPLVGHRYKAYSPYSLFRRRRAPTGAAETVAAA